MPPPGVKFGSASGVILQETASGGTHEMAEEVHEQAADASESFESSEATIAVHWREEGYYPPPPKFIGQANASDPAIVGRFAEENFPECFKEYADLLSWD